MTNNFAPINIVEMINNLKIPLVFTFLLFLGYNLNAQNKFEINPYGGYNVPIGNFSDFAQNGYDFGLSTDYFFGNRFGFGLDFNQQVNSPNNPFDYTRIPNDPNNYTLNRVQNGKWVTNAFGIGPIYRVGNKKFTTDIYSKAGLSIIKTPIYQTTFTFSGLERDLLSLGSEESITSFGITSGVKVNFQLSNRLAFFVNPQYVYTSAKVDYIYREIDNAFVIDPNGVPIFDPGLLIEQPAIEEQLDLSYFNINAGIKLNFGGKKNKKKKIKESFSQETTSCQPTILRSPKEYNNEYHLQFNQRPNFEWNNISASIKRFDFKLLKDGEVVYQKQTKESYIYHNKKLEKIYKEYAKSETTEFEWQVVTYFKNCEPDVSKSKSIIFKNIPGQFHDIFDIECVEPYYNSDGSVNYTAKIEIKHTSNSSSVLEILAGGITLEDGVSSTITIQNLRTCGTFSISISYPINIPQGTTVVYCFDFTVNPGQSRIWGKVEGTIDGIPQISNDENDLPPCVCEICDDGYILPSSKSERITTREYVLTDGSSVFQVASDFLLPTANPIKEIKAEVISVQHQVNDPQCHTCTKDHSRMGMIFDKGNNRIFGTSNWSNSIGTITNAVGNAPGGSTQYANEIKWTAQNQALGVDMSSSNTRILTHIAMPQLSSLDCCHSNFKVCIRYTFTDIDCITCDKVVCYEIDTSPQGSGNNGGIGTGVGNGQNQSGTLLQPANQNTNQNGTRIKKTNGKDDINSDFSNQKNPIEAEPVLVESIENDLLINDDISENESSANRAGNCDPNVGVEVFNDECGKIRIEVAPTSNTNDAYRVRYYWRKSGTTTWWRQTYYNVSNRTDYLAYVQPGYNYDVKILTKAKLFCSYQTRYDRVKLAKNCKQIDFKINDNTKNYCLPINMSTQTNFGLNYASTEFKLCEVNQQGVVIGNCVTETWNSYQSSNIPNQLNLANWAQGKGMNIQRNRYYSFEILSDPKDYINQKEVFFIKSWRDCPVNTDIKKENLEIKQNR